MANEKFPSTAFISQHPVVIAYPTLVTPRAFEPLPGKAKGDPKFGAKLLMRPDHPELTALYNAVINAGEHIPGAVTRDAQGTVTLNPMCKWPFQNGDDFANEPPKGGQARKRSRDPFRGYWIFNAAAPQGRPPSLSIVENGGVRDLPRDEKIAEYVKRYFFGGALVMVKLGVTAWRSELGAGVTIYLNTVLGLGQGQEIAEFAGSDGGGNQPGSAVWGSSFTGHVGQASPINPMAVNPAAPYPGSNVVPLTPAMGGPQVRY